MRQPLPGLAALVLFSLTPLGCRSDDTGSPEPTEGTSGSSAGHAGAGGAGGAGGASVGGCAALLSCCNQISDASTQEACLRIEQTDAEMPNGDESCSMATPYYLAYCSGAGGAPASPSCVTLSTCCNHISDPSTQASCMQTEQELAAMPNSNSQCVEAMSTFAEGCPGVGSGGAAGGTGGCAEFLTCCNQIGDPDTMDVCLGAENDFAEMANGDALCAQSLADYQKSGTCSL